MHWGWSPVLLTESTPVLQGSHHSSLLCAAEGRRKKRREQGRERKPVSLCRKDSAGKSFYNYLSLPAKQGSLSPDLQQHFVYCPPLLTYTRATYKCASQAGKTATPGLLLMMRADVRLVSMNIDVEDSLFHRRTEGGKMAAL